jgi:hypothetical protein
MKEIMVTGDRGIDTLLYAEGFGEAPPTLRKAWVEPEEFSTFRLPGGTGTLIAYLNSTGELNAYDPVARNYQEKPPELAESFYGLTRKLDPKPNRTDEFSSSHSASKGKGKWRVDIALVAGEKILPQYVLTHFCDSKVPDGNVPLILIDYSQGFVIENLCNKNERINEKAALVKLLLDRNLIIRTHDCTQSPWPEIRNFLSRTAHSQKPVIWFSPLQDIDGGSLSHAGNWEVIRERLCEYFRSDETLWDSGTETWLHNIVVQIDNDGAWFCGPEFDKGRNPAGVVYTFPGSQKGSFDLHGYGPVIGGGILFTAALAQVLVKTKSLDDAVQEGLQRCRFLIRHGYRERSEIQKEIEVSGGSSHSQVHDINNLPHMTDPDEHEKPVIYTMPRESPTFEEAVNLIKLNPKAFRERIVLELGDLKTCSPDYAEQLLKLVSRLERHVRDSDSVLSFSILGGPGSGKSFIGKQIAQALMPKFKQLAVMEDFNLSQFTGKEELVDAFQQIQGKMLAAQVPFVLWDEFDTAFGGTPQGWLPHFLMPMQDNRFRGATGKELLGKCIFAFIGGTFHSDDKFKDWLKKDEAAAVKGPDFHSRLSGSIDAPSVDMDEDAWRDFAKPHPAKLERALKIRRELWSSKRKSLRRVSQSVLQFLLHVPLEHGMRSLDIILDSCELADTQCFRLHHLPPPDVLRVHVKLGKEGPGGPVRQFLAECAGCEVLAEKKILELQKE